MTNNREPDVHPAAEAALSVLAAEELAADRASARGAGRLRRRARRQGELPGMPSPASVVLTDVEFAELCAAVAYAQSYWEEDGAHYRAKARAANRALEKVRAQMAPKKYRNTMTTGRKA